MNAQFEKVRDKLKATGKEIYFFVSSQVFLKNFGGIVAFIALFLLITFWWMSCFTRHGESLQVHDYTNMQLQEAIEKARSSSFEVVVNDSSWRRGAAPNIVLSQKPEPFQRVKKNRKIYITVSKSSELVTLPDPAKNDDFMSFKTALERKDVEARIVEKKFMSRLEENTILKVIYQGKTLSAEELANGFQVQKGSTVDFIVSKRTDEFVQIPKLVCKQFDEAAFELSAYDLNLGSIIPDATVTNQNTAYVWKQVPRFSPSGQMRVGEQIEIYLTQYKPENCGLEQNIESGTPDNSGEDEEF